MAYRRSITARAKLFYQQQQRISPSFSHIHHSDSDHEQFKATPTYKNVGVHNYFNQQRLFGSRSLFENRGFVGCGSIFARNFSSESVGGGGGGGGGGGAVEILSDVLGDKAVEVAPVVSEVANAAADSFFPVASLQYLIDYVHCYTGFNWWASIVVTTLLIRWIQLPLMINQLKSTSKFTLLRPKLEAVKEEMQNRGMSPAAVSEGQARMKELFKEYGVTPFTPLKGLLISGPIFCSFFFAVKNMAEKVPSFKEGGALWFTDLTTPDAMYIFPVLTALTFWITVECNAQEGLEGNPTAGTIKNVSRAFAVLTIPFTASFPKAIFCYWMTSNLFSLAYGLVIKKPQVKKFLGIPIIPVTPATTSANQKPGFSFFDALKKYSAAQQQQSLSSPSQQQQSPSLPTEASQKHSNQRVPSSSVLNQRIKSLEREVKGRKKGKKR